MVSVIAAPSACEYLPDQIWQLRYELHEQLTPVEYANRLQRGWRRFGRVMFRPECPACRRCQSLRVPVEAFRPNRSQQRAWRANQGDVSLEIGQPTDSDAHRSLYDRFHRHQSREKGWRDPEDGGAGTFLDNPFETEEWRYTLADRLIGVGYVDRLPQALSAIYFYWDPDERPRSLGTYNVLSIIERARTLGVPNVYLGITSKAAALSPTRPTSSPTRCLARTARGSRSDSARLPVQESRIRPRIRLTAFPYGSRCRLTARSL